MPTDPGGLMAWQPTTRLHVSGYRFLLRRIECALLGRDIRRVNEPIRASMQSLMAGSALAVILLAGCAVLAMVRPQPAVASAPIVMGKQSGALYVRIGETLHPVLNLASARLIVKTNADPQPIPESELGRSKRGPLLGIPGAPQFLAIPLAEDEVRWAVCDGGERAAPSTTVVIGGAEGHRSHLLAGGQSVLVRPVSGGSTYLLYDGRRAVVNLEEPAVVRALGLEGQVPLAVSPTLLNAVPEAPPITAPRIPNTGARGPATLPGFPVGSVLRVARADGDDHYVVLGHGIQRIGQVAADLLRFTDSRGTRTAISIAPDIIRATPIVTELPVDTFPDRAPSTLNPGGTALCVRWVHAASGGAEISFLTGGLPVPADQEPVKLSQADGKGPALDAVYLSPGRSAYVRATGLSGDNPRAGTRYLITDTGVRFAIHDDDAAHDLGLPDTAIPAPWPLLAKLPAGPELSRANASVAQDTLPGGVNAVRSTSSAGSS
jgi:type VII secretion protein EccB